ncbi:MAG: hypothetical protein RLZZ387_1990 [Chloroflexota bacterium]|jgi:hypothetical protein
MSVLLGLCVYCERSPAELVAAGEAVDYESALHDALVSESRIVLCTECLSRFTSPGAADPVRLQRAIITFPPGITAIDHYCVALEDDGLPEAYCEFTMEFERQGTYFVASCPHCGVRVRSLAED